MYGTRKPCPFCGSTNVGIWRWNEVEAGVHVYCNGCGADGPVKDTEEEAEAAWNKRIIRKSKEKVHVTKLQDDDLD